MKIFQCAFLVMMLSVTNIFAALAPFYQSLKEYQELLGDPKLAEKLKSSDLIEDVERQENSFWIRTSMHILQVDVVYDPQEMPGPARFHFVFHDAKPLE